MQTRLSLLPVGLQIAQKTSEVDAMRGAKWACFNGQHFLLVI